MCQNISRMKANAIFNDVQQDKVKVFNKMCQNISRMKAHAIFNDV